MKFLWLILTLLAFLGSTSFANGQGGISIHDSLLSTNNLPSVFPDNHSDYVGGLLRIEAFLDFVRFQIPNNIQELEKFRRNLKDEIITKAGISINHHLRFDYHETGIVRMNGFTIKNIYFQTLQGVFATANLYVPVGHGPFPAIVISNGHWPGARLSDEVEMAAQTLAMNGYVSLCIDAFGSGERGTFPGKEEYHGANLGASILNVGKTLLGIQVSENIRGVDLLCSLPYVDSKRIGATGGSGGGNQTMWLTAIDERVKAAVPVVSAGTFESYVMESNCVCEMLPDGLTFTEESGLLALIAPRPVLLVNHRLDANPTFSPEQMLRSYNTAKPVYEMLGYPRNLSYQLFELPHDYLQADRQSMLSWFDTHIKNRESQYPLNETDFVKLPDKQLKVFPHNERDAKVLSIQDYCKREGHRLKDSLSLRITAEPQQKREELRQILKVNDSNGITDTIQFENQDGWERWALKTESGNLIPLLIFPPQNELNGYTILCDPRGKNRISQRVIDELKKRGYGLAICDLFGVGEASSAKASQMDEAGLVQFHTIARAELWLGKTVMGDWVEDLSRIVQFLNKKGQKKINLNANREAGLAAVFFAALHPEKVDSVVVCETPVSYVFDEREGIDYFSMAIHVPRILNWGDILLAAALSGKNIHFIHPVSMSGNQLNKEDIKMGEAEIRQFLDLYGTSGKTVFSQ
jgi:hypothetical protein